MLWKRVELEIWDLITVLIAMVFAAALSLGFVGFSYADEDGDEAQPTQEEIDELTARVNSKPIYTHKAEGETEGQPIGSQARSMGSYPTYKGTILVTPDKLKGLIPTGHAAIIFRYDTVIESLAEGVTMGPNDWNTSKGDAYGADVKGTTSLQDQAAANWCFNQMGKPYNYNYLDTATRSSFYCSQLVWASFKDKYGIDISTDFAGAAIYPMEILDSPNVSVIYHKN